MSGGEVFHKMGLRILAKNGVGLTGNVKING